MPTLLKRIFLFLCAALTAPAWGGIQRVEDDKFSQDVTIYGGEEYVIPFGDIERHWFIRSWINKKTGVSRHQLYVEIRSPGGYSGFDIARDDSAEDLDVSHLGLPNGRVETVGIALPPEILSQRAASGYQIKLSAKNGNSFIVSISPEQIRSQLATLDRYRPLSPEQQSAAIEKMAETLPLLRMVPSIMNLNAFALLKSSEAADTPPTPSLGLLGVGCAGRDLIVSVGTEFSIKKIWSIGQALTDVRYDFDADDSHRNWARLGEKEAGPQAFVGSFVRNLASAKQLRVAFEVDGAQDRRSVTFDLNQPEFKAKLEALIRSCH